MPSLEQGGRASGRNKFDAELAKTPAKAATPVLSVTLRSARWTVGMEKHYSCTYLKRC